MTASTDNRVLFDVDPEKRIATITLNNPAQCNSYDATMRDISGRGSGQLPLPCVRDEPAVRAR
jgi:hypothetical protein